MSGAIALVSDFRLLGAVWQGHHRRPDSGGDPQRGGIRLPLFAHQPDPVPLQTLLNAVDQARPEEN